MSECRYCGARAYGKCALSPSGVHEHTADSNHCEFCGGRSYGSCTVSAKHRHGRDGVKCIWCGTKNSIGYCPTSSFGRHER